MGVEEPAASGTAAGSATRIPARKKGISLESGPDGEPTRGDQTSLRGEDTVSAGREQENPGKEHSSIRSPEVSQGAVL